MMRAREGLDFYLELDASLRFPTGSDADIQQAFKKTVLTNKKDMDVHALVAICAKYGSRCQPMIHWLLDEFSVDVHARAENGWLRFAHVSPHTIRILHARLQFDVNTSICVNDDTRMPSYAEARLQFQLRNAWNALDAETLVWCGARQTPNVHPDWYPLFTCRSRCARACRALLSRRFVPPSSNGGPNFPHDLRQMLARILWESRVEGVWNK